MSCHGWGAAPVVGASLDDADVYKVSALTGEADPTANTVSLRLNYDELKRAWEVSCASSQATFQEFAREVQAAADTAAQPIFEPITALNAGFADNENALMALTIRVCVRWRWLRIYIIWKI